MRKSAFTLIEVMAVTVVVILIVGIAAPVFARAKKAAKRVTTISNLRQCGIALNLYTADNSEDRDVPSIDTARTVLMSAPTCDPSDTWRTSCTQAFGGPLIGSYGYVRGLRFYNDPAGLAFLRKASNPVIMVSIFYTNPEVPMFHGESPSSMEIATGSFSMPTGIIGLRLDGSVATSKTVFHPGPGVNLAFSWAQAFLGSDIQWEKLP
ncbi:MAG: hypothetical protein P4L46_21745 [Fimbriimonas sp.]|nr:hypothetical protein [Fimbriimonas sp.]